MNLQSLCADCNHDRDWHWTGRGCAGGNGCTCRYFYTNETHVAAVPE